MANNIKILDPHEAIKIAAGEVIERPANIVKELIENSIDAGATSISVYITAAGKEMIKIVDNGCGMNEIDAKLCFAHHATSKINKVEDLGSITTYGFRGEALSSIAAMSHVELTSKTSYQKIGSRVVIQNSTIMSQEAVACVTGTTCTITQLFNNMPARKKFLKTDETEWNQIVAIFQAFCLRYLSINFSLYHNNHQSYNCPATTTITTRCAQLWDSNLYEQIIPIESQKHKDFTVHGAISTPHFYRFNRHQIFTFVNNRWVKNQELSKGIIQGYLGSLPHQKYPAAFLFVSVDPKLIDVNVHPKKEEVKFLHPQIIQNFITALVQEALRNYVSSKISTIPMEPAVTSSHQNISLPKTSVINPSSLHVQPVSGLHIQPTFAQKTQESFRPLTNNHNKTPHDTTNISSKTYIHDIRSQHQQITPQQTIEDISSPFEQQKTFQEAGYVIIGQFQKTYIIIDRDSELIMIDQHAAHERIVYNRLIHEYSSPCIQLMFPHAIKTSTQSIEKLYGYQHMLQEHGICLQTLDQTTLLLTATPVGMQATAAAQIVSMIIDMLQTETIIEHNLLREKIIAEKACKTACKAGDSLDLQQMQELVKQLFSAQDSFCCPHGRPTMWAMSQKELEKHFKRNYVGNKQKNMNLE